VRSSAVLRVATCVAVLAAIAGCNDETSTVLAPMNRKAYNFLLTKEGSNVPRGDVNTTRSPAAAGSVNTFTLTLRGLEKLKPGAFYQVWIGTVAAIGGTSKDSAVNLATLRRLASNDFVVTKVDTTISPAGDFVPNTTTLVNRQTCCTSGFNEGGPGVTIRMRTNTASLGVNPSTLNLVLVTLVTDTVAPPPPDAEGSQARLWSRFRTPGTPPAATPANPDSSLTFALGFGNFHATPSKQYTFVASGRGRGSLLSDKNVLILDDSILARPPKGYYYESWLIARDDNVNFFAKDSLSLGPQTAPYPRRSISLYGADSAQVDQVIQSFPALIFAAASRVQGDSLAGLSTTTANRFRGIANAYVTLEAKLGTPDMSPAIILSATMPPPIRTRDK
jgi:hypothetical protein